jgi:hypothetical protein
MTQPYTPPPVPYQSYPMMATDPRRPFKRASLLMFILGGLMLLMAGCTALVARTPTDQFPPEMQAEFSKLLEPTGYDLKTYLLAVAAYFGVPALLLIGTGVGVRFGKRGWIVGALILTGLLLTLLVLSVVGAFAMGHTSRAIGNACALAVPIGLFVLLFVWLLEGYRAAGRAAPTAYFQQAQPSPMHVPPPPQAGYGYGQPPVSNPAPPSQPPQNPPPTAH